MKKKVSGNTLIVPGTHYENDPNVTLINYMSPMDSITFSELEYPYVSLTHFITDQPPNIIRDEEPFSKTFGLFQQMGLYSRNGTEYRMNSSSTIQYMRIGKRLKSRIRRAYMQTRYISFITGAPMFKKSYFSDLLSNEGGRYYPDILMTPKGYLGGVALDWLIGTYGQGRIYGNSTLEVLETVGYATWRKPVTIEFSNTTFPSNP